MLRLRPFGTVRLFTFLLWTLATLASPAHARELQLQDYGLWTYYQLSDNGVITGSVTQENWRQIWRSKYVSYDAAGEPIATAQQTGLYKGRIFNRNAELTFTAQDGTALGMLQGSLWALYAASFTLTDPLGSEVAHLTVDRHAQLITARSPSNWNVILGYMARVQQATRGKDSWTLALPSLEVAIDERVWPLVAAFFADSWSHYAQAQSEG
jgi:hypothetical protein